jgi:hypothetical protein
MCHYHTQRCKLCHHILSSRPINCGYGLAILGPQGMTIECAHEDVEEVEETKLCCECAERTKEEEGERAWIRWTSWRRGAGSGDME